MARTCERRDRESPAGDAGFTLVEILAVLAILSLLMTMAIYGFGKQREHARVVRTKGTMEELEMLITRYEASKGDAPPDSLAKLKIRADNDANEGAEALYAALHDKSFPQGTSIDEEKLVNSDGDSTASAYHRNGITLLFEVADGWGNPIAYLRPTSYGKQFRYVMAECDDPADSEQVVSSHKSAVTGVWANPDTFQLVSAGADRRFGTEDDVTNFK